MMSFRVPALALSVACLSVVGFAAPAYAAPTVYFGQNITPLGGVSGDPLTKRLEFMGKLSGVDTETFESFSDGNQAPLDLTFQGSGTTELKARITGGLGIFDAPFEGRYNTTSGGTDYFEVGDLSPSFNITFETAISAFGFYATDVGDFSGRIKLLLTDSSNVVTELIVNSLVNQASGGLIFWGFTDLDKTYKSISFLNTSDNGIDSFAFDDMVIGDRGQILPPNPAPEPGSLALVGLSLLALTASRRRRG